MAWLAMEGLTWYSRTLCSNSMTETRLGGVLHRSEAEGAGVWQAVEVHSSQVVEQGLPSQERDLLHTGGTDQGRHRCCLDVVDRASFY